MLRFPVGASPAMLIPTSARLPVLEDDQVW
jgi:hypothetical protein